MCINGLKVPLQKYGQSSTLKCSFGTSKYCSNFLKDSRCNTEESPNAICPFLHYIERRRDKVIQDDYEFKEFIQQQEDIVTQFMTALNLKKKAVKCDYFNPEDFDSVCKQGFPSTSLKLGHDLTHLVQGKLPAILAATINSIEYL